MKLDWERIDRTLEVVTVAIAGVLVGLILASILSALLLH